MISRSYYLKEIANAFAVHPVVAILGPRQCGKTTLAKEYIQMANEVAPLRNYFDLEDPTDLNRIQDPKVALEGLSGLIVIRDR